MSKYLVAFVIVLVAAGYALFIGGVLLPWAGWWFGTFWGLLNLLYLHLDCVMLAWSYYLSITVDAGSVPFYWRPVASEDVLTRAKEEAIAREKDIYHPGVQGIRYCARCRLYRPPRAFHCRKTQRCVLRMDHFCPWVNNCVGFYNHKAFVLFCFWAGWTILHYHAFFIRRFYEIMTQPIPPAAPVLFFVVDFCIFAPVSILILALFGWQFQLLVRGKTSMEHSVEQRARATDPSKRKAKHPYDLGVVKNFTGFFGSNPLLWLAPWTPTVGDGLAFPTNGLSAEEA